MSIQYPKKRYNKSSKISISDKAEKYTIQNAAVTLFFSLHTIMHTMRRGNAYEAQNITTLPVGLSKNCISPPMEGWKVRNGNLNGSHFSQFPLPSWRWMVLLCSSVPRCIHSLIMEQIKLSQRLGFCKKIPL